VPACKIHVNKFTILSVSMQFSGLLFFFFFAVLGFEFRALVLGRHGCLPLEPGPFLSFSDRVDVNVLSVCLS
jgi:hypothetical protein